jgi:DNA-binding transcriptional LysR family regulator
LDIRQLQNVVTVIEKGSLGRAAAALNMSQPALTKSIQRLEVRLGVPLFTRDSKGMRPTLYGEALRPHAHGILASTEQAAREIESMRSGAQGTVNIACGPLNAREILASAMIRLLREYPLVHVNVHTAIGDHTPGLLAGHYEFILTQLPLGSHTNGLVQRELVKDRISVIARIGHDLERRSKVTASDLLQYKWVLPERGHNHRIRLSRVFEMENLPMPEPDVECSSTEFIKSVVGRTDHLGLVAQMGIGGKGDLKLIEIPLESPFMVRPIGLVWRENQVLSSSSRLLISAIEEVCRTKNATQGSASRKTRFSGRHRVRIHE